MTNSLKLNHWCELLAQYCQCNLTVAEFCEQHQVRVHQFYYWREKVEALSSSSSSALVPAQLATPRAVTDMGSHGLGLPAQWRPGKRLEPRAAARPVPEVASL